MLQFSTLLTFFTLATATVIPNTRSLPSNATHQLPLVPYGVYIHHCTVPGTVALTFDDGPYIYTSELLDLLASYGARSTFFVNGHNIHSNTDVIQRIVDEGHQLASHTYGHANLATLDYEGIVEQMTVLEDILEKTVGVIPTYMRPPYLAVNELTLDVMAELGYHVIGASVDTKDYENDHPDLVGRSVAKFNRELDQGGTIILAHDIHEQTVRTLASILLDEIESRGLEPVTVGECLGDPEEEWYRTV